jgi:poly-gamma-glutamate synthesis protein (capsule biosynthesis protein)
MKKGSWVLIGAIVLLFILVFFLSFKENLFKNYSAPVNSVTVVTAGAKTPGVPVNRQPIGAQYTDISLFLSPIKQNRTLAATSTVTGLIVPHHLLAKDLATTAFAFAARNKYQTIVLLSPDHFQAGKSVVSVTERNFSTVFGDVTSDIRIVRQLKNLPFVSEGDFFYREHGLQAELPFIKYYFPTASVVALTFKPDVTKIELDQIIAILEQTLPPNSLVVQSTDFSHYLTPSQAASRDNATIAAIEQGAPAKILRLNQPANIDSLAAQYIQASLQQDFFKSHLNILEHKNSQDYTTSTVTSSTSYLAAAYIQSENSIPPAAYVQSRDSVLPIASAAPVVAEASKEPGSAKYIFVGDVMLSRYIGDLMAERKNYDFPFALVKPFLANADLVFGNLETPISDRGASTGALYPFRASPLAVNGLKDAGFQVLSVANNHAFDYGPLAFSDTLDNLKKAGLSYAGGGHDFTEAHQGAYREINGIKTTFLAYTDLLPKSDAASDTRAGISYLDIKQMAQDIKAAKKNSDLVIVSFHWGREYETKHNDRQAAVAAAAIQDGASLVIGHHPHVPQEVDIEQGATVAYSLGNFIFDQNFSPETATGLALVVEIKDKKIVSVEKKSVYFNHFFQPYLSESIIAPSN